MKIHVIENGVQKVNLHLPTGLLLNRFTACLAPHFMKDNDSPPLTGAQAYRFIKALKEYKANHPEWVLVEVQSANGDYVEIRM